MHVLHLTTSTFFGGPERQILGLASASSAWCRSTIASFSESGRCRDFLNRSAAAGLTSVELPDRPFPYGQSVRELADTIRTSRPDVLVMHGYKSNLLGRPAARRTGIPAVSVSRGWTGETLKVRGYDLLDRLHLRFMDQVVCVSQAQARKVAIWGVPARRRRVIHNAVRTELFTSPAPQAIATLRKLAGGGTGPIVLAAGRLSREKGFQVLVEAAGLMTGTDARFVQCGEGRLEQPIRDRARALRIEDRFHLVGFRHDVDQLVSACDLVVLPSFTEGLPNAALEAAAAGKPIVATAVGGTPEVVVDRQTGLLVPPGRPEAIAAAVRQLLAAPERCESMGRAARARAERHFSFAVQAEAYRDLLESLIQTGRTTTMVHQ